MLDRKETKCEWCNHQIFETTTICSECFHEYDFEDRYQRQRGEMNKWGCNVYEFRQGCKRWGIRFGTITFGLFVVIIASTIGMRETKNIYIGMIGITAFLPLMLTGMATWFCLLGWEAQAPRKRY